MSTPDRPAPVRRQVRRPGAGQSARRAPRGWRPRSIVDAYLMSGEIVVREETRSIRGFLAGHAVLIALAVLFPLFVATTGSSALVGLALLCSLALAAYLLVRGLQAWFTRYVVTDLRVLRVSGVLNRNAEFIPWGKITDVSRSESFVQWLAHTATIRIESANERSSFRAIDDIDDPGTFYRVLVQMVDRRHGRISNVSGID